MSWQQYVDRLMAGTPELKESAAVVCYTAGGESVWAASESSFMAITTEEIRRLVSPNRGDISTTGIMLAGVRYSLINDTLLEDEGSMTVMSKDKNSVCIGRSSQALILVRGCKSVHGRAILSDVIDVAKHLKSSGF